MYLKVDEAKRQCQIWIPFKERDSYKNEPKYIESINEYESKGYQIYEFQGGQNPTLPIFTAMLEKQMFI